MSLFLNVRNPKVFETRADEDYGDAYEQFRTDVVELLVQAVADKTGGKVMMRPANDENGLATKKPSTAKDKAKTWGKYKEKSFAGRDDGMMRANS